MMFLKLSIRNLNRNIRRSLLILFTIASGVCALMIYHGFNTGIMNQYRENTIHSRYGHGQITNKGYYDSVFEKPWEHWIENPKSLYDKLDTISEIKFKFPRIQFFALLNNGNSNIAGKGQGIDTKAESAFFNTLNIEEGEQLVDQTDGILLGKGLAKALQVKVGDRVTVLVNTIYGSMNAADLFVTGIFHTGVKEFDDMVFRLPLSQAQSLLDTNKIESISLGLSSVEEWPTVAEKINKLVPEVESISFDVLDKVYYQNSVDFLKSQFSFIFTIIFLIVALGIFNSISSSILERRFEIGNLMANGQTNKSIITLLFLESLIMSLIGAILGVAIAYILNLTILSGGIPMPPGPGITRQFLTFIELQPSFIFTCFFTAIVATLAGTLLASWKVITTPIASLLRTTA